jgi:pimeloyl-ACP methyl ester carboxylesterase
MPHRLVLGLLVGAWLVPSGLRADAPQVKKPFFDSAGVKIHYLVTGKQDGEPVLLIHGFTARIETQWPTVLKALAKDFKLIALDCRGHGGSEKPRDPKQYGLHMTRDAIRLLDHLKIDRAHVVGYSMGGGIALQIAVRYPDRARTVTLGGMGLPLRDRDAFAEKLAESLEEGKGIGPLIVALTPMGRPRPTEEQMKAISARVLGQNDAKALAAVIRGSIKNKDLALSDEQVKGIRVPMLALIGAQDPLRPGVAALKKQLPALKVVLIDKADHITAFSRPEFSEGLKEFLQAHSAK